MSFRIAPPAAPGSLFKQPAPARKKKLQMGRQVRERDTEHLEAVRACPCISCGLDNRCEAAHIRISRGRDTGGGTALKPSDNLVTPLCVGCHREQHAGSEVQFWEAIGIDPFLVAAKLYAVSPNVELMRAIVHLFIAARVETD